MRKKCNRMFHPEYLQHRQERGDPKCAFKSLAFKQLEDAYAAYTPGVPVNYGNETFLEHTLKAKFPLEGTTTVETYGCVRLLRIASTAGNTNAFVYIMEPPSDPKLGVTPIYPYHLCGSCGAETKSNGKPLTITCTGCKERKYCSKRCGKKHMKYHTTM